jgi:RHS repeat-associated protein
MRSEPIMANETTRILLLTAVVALLLPIVAFGGGAQRYIVILKHFSGPSPDVERLGGTIEFRQREELVVVLPPAAVDALRQDPLVRYVQSVGASEPTESSLLGTPTEPSPRAAGPSAWKWRPRAEGSITWDSHDYTYDAAGNTTDIGTTESYRYDKVQRLVKATINGVVDNYSYDEFGNMTAKSVGGTVTNPPAVDHHTNQCAASSGCTYDAAGNLTSDGRWSFSYDALGQPMSKQFNGANQAYYVYTAGDERIAVQENLWWIWSLRGEDGKVLRQYRSSVTNPSVAALWLEDFVWSDGLLLGSQRPAELGGRRHFHLDHLGTPRLITSDNGQQESYHDYYPFGDERSPVQQEIAGGFDREEPMKFTGHERDFAAGQGREGSDYIDYMHARYYGPGVGRFLSVDPLLDLAVCMPNPQAWNRYGYVRDNPINRLDPNGMADKVPQLDNIHLVHDPNDHLHLFDGVELAPAGAGGPGDLNCSGCRSAAAREGQAQALKYGGSLDALLVGGVFLPEILSAGPILQAAIRFSPLLGFLQNWAAEETSTPSPRALATRVASSTGGAVKELEAGYHVAIPYGRRGIAIRIMEEGGGRANYYRVSIPGKQAFTIAGEASRDRALTHIPITPTSFEDIMHIVRGIMGGH